MRRKTWLTAFLQLIQIHQNSCPALSAVAESPWVLVLFLLVLHFLVAIDGEVVLVAAISSAGTTKAVLRLSPEQGVDGAGADIALDHLPVLMPLGDGVRQVVAAFAFQLAFALVVQ